MKIKNIIFDIGNVIVKWSPPEIINCTFPNCSPEQKQLLMKEIFKSDIWINLNLGKISEEEAKLKYLSGIEFFNTQTVDQFFHYIKVTQTLIPGAIELLKTLHNNNYLLFALTDNIKEIVHYLRAQYDFWQYFSHVTVSANVGLMKPGKEIFDYVIRENNLLPNETLFIDDHPPNIETAHSLGLHTILFSDSATCLQELNRLGINAA